MRTYATIRGTFWKRGSGKRLKGDHIARELALYLMTCSQGTACGIFYISLPEIAHDLGESVEEIRSVLGRISEIAEYDEDEELCWVPNTAREQIGEELKANDKRRQKLIKELEQFGRHPFVSAFAEKYRESYQLRSEPEGASKGHRRGIEGASVEEFETGSPQHSTAQHSTGLDQVGGFGDGALGAPGDNNTSDTLVPCPREILDGDTIAIIASALKVSPAAVRGGLKEFKDYWTIGAGAGRRHSLAKWRAKAREDVRQKAGRGLLLEPETAETQASEVDNERRNSERLAREQAYAAQARERLLGGPVATLSAVRRRNGPEAPTETKAREMGAQEQQQTARVAQ
jgi:hypothetical protein